MVLHYNRFGNLPLPLYSRSQFGYPAVTAQHRGDMENAPKLYGLHYTRRLSYGARRKSPAAEDNAIYMLGVHLGRGCTSTNPVGVPGLAFLGPGP
jgi:hypothetical protein